jgi:ribonuclease P protein component
MTENDCEAHFSTLEACPQAPAWLPVPHGHDGRPQGDRAPPVARPQAVVRLKRAGALSPNQTIDRIVKRQDFLAAAKASSFAAKGVVVQMRDRKDKGPARTGFTVTKKLGDAVTRNRIKRRLREAARLTLPGLAEPGHDYVLIGRAQGLERPFSSLQNDIRTALKRLHTGGNSANR